MIENQKVVKVIYDLYVDGQEGGQEELMERATEQHPLVYCHGEGMMLPMFEANLAGKEQGEKFDFRIPCHEAYGEYDTDGVLDLDKEMFLVDGKLDERVFVGNVVQMYANDGQIVNAQVVEITDQKVTIDLNHPLAGENLHFIGTILEVREATEAELNSLHHKGCSCGCGHDHNCGDGCEGCGGGCGECN